jgi:hypothetical protein
MIGCGEAVVQHHVVDVEWVLQTSIVFALDAGIIK